MVTLGMSAHTDRLLRLMVENGVTNTAVLERHLVIFWWFFEDDLLKWMVLVVEKEFLFLLQSIYASVHCQEYLGNYLHRNLVIGP